VQSDETPPADAAATTNGEERGFPDRSLIDLSRTTAGEPEHLAPDDAGDRPLIDLSRDPTPGVADHAAPEGAELDPLIDLSRDPNPGVADHAVPDDDEGSAGRHRRKPE
jgi:hypothetical protein